MSQTQQKKHNIEMLVLGAIFTALVFILQYLGSFIRFGIFSVSLVLLPIILGAATCGYKIGAWLGFVFAVAVFTGGDATLFFSISPFGTIITVFAKGILCGLLSGLTYEALKDRNQYFAIIVAAIVCPIVNTGVFLLGCRFFFMEAIKEWGAAAGFNNAVSYMFLGLAGGNFLFELGINLILSPVVIRILKAMKIE